MIESTLQVARPKYLDVAPKEKAGFVESAGIGWDKQKLEAGVYPEFKEEDESLMSPLSIAMKPIQFAYDMFTSKTTKQVAYSNIFSKYNDYNDNKDAYESVYDMDDHDLKLTEQIIGKEIYKLDENNNVVPGAGYFPLAETLFVSDDKIKGSLLARKNGFTNDQFKQEYKTLVTTAEKELNKKDTNGLGAGIGAIGAYFAEPEMAVEFMSPGRIIGKTILGGATKALATEALYAGMGEAMRQPQQMTHNELMDRNYSYWDAAKEVAIAAGFGGVARAGGSLIADWFNLATKGTHILPEDRAILEDALKAEEASLTETTVENINVINKAEYQINKGEPVDIAAATSKNPIDMADADVEEINIIDEIKAGYDHDSIKIADEDVSTINEVNVEDDYFGYNQTDVDDGLTMNPELKAELDAIDAEIKAMDEANAQVDELTPTQRVAEDTNLKEQEAIVADKDGINTDSNEYLLAKFTDNVLAGTVAGIEEDENGNITFDPEKFVLGLGGYTVAKQALKYAAKDGRIKQEMIDYAARRLDEFEATPAGKAITGKQEIFAGGSGASYENKLAEGKVTSNIYDKEQRYWIDDIGAEVKQGSWGTAEDIKAGNQTYGRLSEMLQHDELFKEYPDLKDVKVHLVPDMEGASYDPIANRIVVGYSTDTKQLNKSSLLHEVQHAIQEIEGFAKGGNPEQFKNTNELRKLYRTQQQEIKDDYGYDEWEFDLMVNNPDRFQRLMKLGEKDFSLKPLYEEFARTHVEKDLKQYFVNKMTSMDRKINEIESGNPMEMYKRLAGEQEARAVQAKLEHPDLEPYEALKKVEGKLPSPIVQMDYADEVIAKSVSKLDNGKPKGLIERRKQERIDAGLPESGGREIYHPDRDRNYFYHKDTDTVYFESRGKWREMPNEEIRKDIKYIDKHGVKAYKSMKENEDIEFNKAIKESEDIAVKQAETYKDSHAAPTREQDNSTSIDDLTKIYPDDIYSANGARYYGHGDDVQDRISMNILNRIKGKPKAKVTIYRSIPKDIDADINIGDWVTINKQYAREHGENRFDGEYTILEKRVNAEDIITDGNSIHEQGYDPKTKGNN